MIVSLNGTSSSGKSSIARELQQKLPGPYILFVRDDFRQMLPPAFWHDPDMRRQTGSGLFRGFQMSIAGFVRAGVPLIVDHVINQPEWGAELDEVL